MRRKAINMKARGKKKSSLLQFARITYVVCRHSRYYSAIQKGDSVMFATDPPSLSLVVTVVKRNFKRRGLSVSNINCDRNLLLDGRYRDRIWGVTNPT